jgi:hypothetical protein
MTDSEETAMDRTWMPTVAGILNLIAGGLALFGLMLLALAVVVLNIVPEARGDEVGFVIAQSVLAFAGIATLLLAVLAILGGASAIQRKRWGWTIAGSVAATLICAPLGIPAIVLVVMAEKEIRSS